MRAALYIHIPFCAKKCAYCDFASCAGRERDWTRYLSALEGEIHDAARRYGRFDVDTVYFGGGTPSVLPEDAVVHLMAMARALFRVGEDAEITVECNPGTVSPEKLRAYRDAGVNRLSFGMQAADDAALALLGRVHRHADVEQAVAWAREAGFRNLNLDLMYALPNQTMKDWVASLKAALLLKPEHLSLYSLILEPGTPLAQSVADGTLPAPDDETALAMQHAAQRILSGRGYARYEISNYALPGRACRHNMAYWTRANYLGLGCAAHSLMDEVRFANTASLDDYLAGVREITREAITPESAREESILLGTRTAQGIPLPLVAANPEAVERLSTLGLITLTPTHLRLTDAGFDVQNQVVLALVQSRKN